ncbi:MAG TPA: hypothetical protein PKW61_08085, partial [Tenuifilaceae bacterium]|nr:hypothetical protein [Tenuifilaceae bacterium]
RLDFFFHQNPMATKYQIPQNVNEPHLGNSIKSQPPLAAARLHRVATPSQPLNNTYFFHT